MKKLKQILGLMGIMALLGAGAGCASMPGERSQFDTITDLVHVAAYAGTAAALLQNPEWRPAFELARGELAHLEAQEEIGFPVVAAIVQRFPVEQLHGPTATISIMTTTLLLHRFGDPIKDLADVEDVRRVVRALREGLDLALGPPGPS